MISPAIPDPRNTTRNATYHRTADLTSLNTSAPSGARIAQRPTPPASRNPPSGIIDSVGASRMSTWPTRSSHGKSRVRENTAIAPSRTPKYTSGTTPTGDPSARYSAPHSAATGRINTEIRTSSVFRPRRSSSSRGSAPTSIKRAATRSAAGDSGLAGASRETLAVEWRPKPRVSVADPGKDVAGGAHAVLHGDHARRLHRR